MRTSSRPILSTLGAGLLTIGGLAPAFPQTTEPDWSMQVDHGLVTISAQDVPVEDIIVALARAFGLRLVQHAALDRTVTIDVAGEPLSDVLGSILRNDSYQLYVARNDEADDSGIPGILWIFAQGSALIPAATVFLEAVLLEGTAQEKRRAIDELRRLGTPTAVQALSLALGDDNERIRDRAFEALESISSDEALAAIASAAMDSDPWVRSEAVTALASGDSDTAARYLTLALDDPDPRVRMSVVEALADVPMGALPSQQTVAALNRALKDENPEVRLQAIESLEEIGGDIAFQALMQARADRDPEVAEAAGESLSSLADKQ